jgi:hypothetical protein
MQSHKDQEDNKVSNEHLKLNHTRIKREKNHTVSTDLKNVSVANRTLHTLLPTPPKVFKIRPSLQLRRPTEENFEELFKKAHNTT